MLLRDILLICLVVGAALPDKQIVRMMVPSAADDSRGGDNGGSVPKIIEDVTESSCGLLFLDVSSSQIFPFEKVWEAWQRRRGAAKFCVASQTNVTHRLSHLASLARRVRQSSRCTMVVVVSQDPAFLAAFAEWSLRGRLLVWATKLVVVTRLALSQLQALLPAHWTFSMMNTVFLNVEDLHSDISLSHRSYSVYCYMPYGRNEEGIVEVAPWTRAGGPYPHDVLLASKFNNFYGTVVNVTALPFMPFWGEEEARASDGSLVTRFKGSDYQLLVAVAAALNFTFRVLPSDSWQEATRQVEKRKSFMCPVYHVLMTVRAETYDFTYTYEYAYFSFAMGKPGQEPQWLSLYYPLVHQVWLAVGAALFLVPLIYSASIRVQRFSRQVRSVVAVFQDMTGILLGQDLPHHLPSTSSSRILVSAWLIFALVFGTAYRGNLTACLTLPKYPPRPETLQQLVGAVKRVTIPAYGTSFLDFYRQSDFPLFNQLASLMNVGPSVMQGLQEATEKRQAHLGGRRYLQHVIAETFTEADGTTRLYLGKESVFPGPSGWPIPHDAPYKAQLDRWIMATIEAGLYEKWIADIITETTARSKMRQRKSHQKGTEILEDGGRRGPEALSLTHMQGAFLILMLGVLLAAIALAGETLHVGLSHRTQTL